MTTPERTEEREAMTETETRPAVAISVPARELRSRLKAVMPHAGTDDMLPSLTCVLFEVRDGSLYLAATDRYTMGVARLRIPGAEAAAVTDQRALLPPQATRELRRLLKGADGVAAVIFGDGRLTVDAGTGSCYAWKTQPGSFPSWRPMLHGMLAHEMAELGNSNGVSAVKLARFAVEASKQERLGADPLHIRVTAAPAKGMPGELHPVLLVRRGDWFLGCLMPVHLNGTEPDADPWADWAAVMAPAETAEAAK